MQAFDVSPHFIWGVSGRTLDLRSVRGMCHPSPGRLIRRRFIVRLMFSVLRNRAGCPFVLSVLVATLGATKPRIQPSLLFSQVVEGA